MRIDRLQNTISFKRALTPSEEKSYAKVLQQAKELVGQTGNSILIMPTSSLPQTSEFNSGVGHLSSKISQDFLKYMKTYYGINVIEDLPAGQIREANGYKGSSLDLGVHQINPELLATDEFEHLLSKEDLKEISRCNNSSLKNQIANFKNVLEKGSETDKALTRAFTKFQELPETSQLKVKYKKFITENADWLEFPRSYEPNQEFFKFKQFLAEAHLRIGKAKTNKLGLKLCGDCPIGFSNDEVRAFPNAFFKDRNIKIGDWQSVALNYSEITNPSSDAYKLLKKKIQLAARRYDMIRMDVGWAYVTPKLTTISGEIVKPQMDSVLLNQIEEWVKEVKGSCFDTQNIIYEVEAGEKDFNAFDKNGLIAPFRNRLKIYTSQYMHDNGFYDRWGYTQAFLDKGLTPNEFIIGVGNHDSQPLRQMAEGIEDFYAPVGQHDHRTGAIKVLSRIFGISEKTLKNPVEFSKAKFAEPMMAKHNMVFFADIFGFREAFNKHWDNAKITPGRNFAFKVSSDFKKKLHQVIQEGHGFNIMDSLAKVFSVKGYDETYPDLFNKIVRYRDILDSTADDAFQYTKGRMLIVGAIAATLGLIISAVSLANKKNNKLLSENASKKA